MPDNPNAEDMRREVARDMTLVAMSYAFANCKNIEVRAVDPPAMRKKARRRGDVAYRYHVLEIDKATMRRAYGDAGETYEHMPLHLCRGHFKSYTQEKPLFGRLTGTWWWPQHVRGSATSGVVDKDYKVGDDA